MQCGEPTERADLTRGYCGDCRPEELRERERRGHAGRTKKDLGYDAAWDRLSQQARKRQRFCSDCGTTDDLTADHSPEAWRRKAAGKPIRLIDVDVCCRSCNAKRGKARPGDTTSPQVAPNSMPVVAADQLNRAVHTTTGVLRRIGDGSRPPGAGSIPPIQEKQNEDPARGRKEAS